MSTALENQPFWPKIVAELKKKRLRDLAKEYRVPVADLQKALERVGILPGSTNAKAAEPAKAAAAPGNATKASVKAAEAAPAVARRGNATAKLEGVRDQLGKVADGVLAEKLGVARKTVVEFRKKNGIPAWSGKSEAKASPEPAVAAAPARRGRPPKVQAEPVPVAAAVTPPRRGRPPKQAQAAAVVEAPKGRGRPSKSAAAAAPAEVSVTGRASRLDAFRHLIGKVPDREVAELTGMTTENVRMFRQRRGIQAEWRAPAAAPAAKDTAKAPKASATPAKVEAAPAKVEPKPAKVEPKPAKGEAKAPKAEPVKADAAPVKAAAKPAAAVEAAPRKRGRQPAAPGESKVEVALARFKADIGTLPDADVAVKAGVSRSAVSAYRQKHRIKASGKGGRPPKNRVEAAPKTVVAPAPKVEAPKAAVANEAPKAVVAKVEAPKAAVAKVVEAPKAVAPAKVEAPAKAEAKVGGFVYRVTAIREGEKRTFGLIASDPVEAAQRAVDHFGKKGKWVIRDIRLIAEALPT